MDLLCTSCTLQSHTVRFTIIAKTYSTRLYHETKQTAAGLWTKCVLVLGTISGKDTNSKRKNQLRVLALYRTLQTITPGFDRTEQKKQQEHSISCNWPLLCIYVPKYFFARNETFSLLCSCRVQRLHLLSALVGKFKVKGSHVCTLVCTICRTSRGKRRKPKLTLTDCTIASICRMSWIRMIFPAKYNLVQTV